MARAKLTVRLPEENLAFLKEIAAANHVTVTEMIGRYLMRLRKQMESPIHPEVQRVTGLVPADVNAREVWRATLERKHS